MATIAGFMRNLPDLTIQKVIQQFKNMDKFKETNFTVVSRSVVITGWPVEAEKNSFEELATKLGFDCQYL